MKKFIIINGSFGVGKTAVGKRLCDILGRAAFIDGDWCLDIHPFVGNKETKAMAIDNILHMVRNYHACGECDTVVLSWIISENNISKITAGVADLDFRLYYFVLVCDEKTLTDRWNNDTVNAWRNDENLKISLSSMESDFKKRKSPYIIIDTSDLSVDESALKLIEKLS